MRVHHTLFSRQTVLLWHTKESPRLAEPQPQTKGARCWDPKWSGASNAIIVYKGAVRCRVSHVRHISGCWQPQWKERERPLRKKQVPGRKREFLPLCLMSGTLLLGIPSSSQIDNMVYCSQQPNGEYQEWPLQGQAGKAVHMLPAST